MAETTDDNNKKEQFNYYGVISSLLYISIIIAFGIPLWWKTTSPSRHSLPDISALLVSSQRIVHKFPISIIAIDDTIDREQLRSQLVSNWPQKIDAAGSLAYIYEWKVRPLVAKEHIIFERNGVSLTDIDDELNVIDGYSKKGKLWIYLLPDNATLSQQLVVFGKHRFIYIKNSEQNFGDKSLPELIVEVVESTLDLSNKLYNSKKTSLLLSPEIDVIVSIINENGNNDEILSNKIDEIHRIADTGLISQSGVSELIKLNVISQVLHYTLNEQFVSSHLYRTNVTTNSNERLFEISDVPILMNTIESRIVEHNNKQSYHILLFIPSSDRLYFYDSTLKSKSNLIVTPYRGGILIWNNANDFVNGFRSLTRNLLGLPQALPKNSLRNNLFFNKWELDAIRRSISQMQLLKTLASLESINKLIEKVGNIVIIEEIAQRMHTAVDLSHQSIDCLADADLNSAFKLSTRAYLSSETAFFDSSLLSLLYFPDDQKYAVYFPLFLPVSLPILSSIYYLFKVFKNRNKLKVD